MAYLVELIIDYAIVLQIVSTKVSQNQLSIILFNAYQTTKVMLVCLTKKPFRPKNRLTAVNPDERLISSA